MPFQAVFSTDFFLNFDNCQPEVASDVVYSVVVDPTALKVCVKFGDSRSNCSRDIRLLRFVTNARQTTPAYADQEPYQS